MVSKKDLSNIYRQLWDCSKQQASSEELASFSIHDFEFQLTTQLTISVGNTSQKVELEFELKWLESFYIY